MVCFWRKIRIFLIKSVEREREKKSRNSQFVVRIPFRRWLIDNIYSVAKSSRALRFFPNSNKKWQNIQLHLLQYFSFNNDV